MSNNATWLQQQAANRTEDIRWLAETGETVIGAAARLGISTDALEKFCAAHHLRPELAQLRSNVGPGHVRQGRVGVVLA